MSCIKNSSGVESIASLASRGSAMMKTEDCANSLKTYLENSKCHQFHTVERSQWDYFIKCAGYFPQDEKCHNNI